MSYSSDPKPLKRSVIKEELVALTGNFKLAIILNQMLYWSERVQDFDAFILEERERATMSGAEEPNLPLRRGWIFKKAEELAEETMLGLNVSSMLRLLNQLVDQGWLEKRRNPKNHMDKTYQYRVNVVKIQRDLQAKGYALEGYPLLIENPRTSNLHFANTDFQNANSNLQNANSDLQNVGSDLHFARAIPEITTEITYRESKEEDIDVYDHERTQEREIMSIHRTLGRISPSDPSNTRHLGDNTYGAWNRISSVGGQAAPLEETSSSSSVSPRTRENTMRPGSSTPLIDTGDGRDLPDISTYNVPWSSPNDPYLAVDYRMMQHLGRPYIAKENDYRAIKQLLASGVPIDFILEGIDYTFATFADKHIRSFAYCAEVIKQRWTCELVKRQEVEAVNWAEYQPAKSATTTSRPTRNQPRRTRATKRDERYEAFYQLFPECAPAN
ncbi:helix-turn-helix domain-containing protein [Alicyclobacillus shizuokensis]|uniref:helix-turn-helix domain-containing protein n=1 Tax=Alicyclobacillus shizuokensis TaxID=392014 RepID=UPI000834AE70|nr:helix-turn-helix domain-containing protein [Alicyclobacillus shizuokensis]